MEATEALPLPDLKAAARLDELITNDSGAPSCPDRDVRLNDSVGPRIPAKHPAVDTRMYGSNDQIMSCMNNAGCDTDEVCYLGACVPAAWDNGTACGRAQDGTCDPMVPPEFVIGLDVPGTLERQRFTGDGTDYRLYLSTALRP